MNSSNLDLNALFKDVDYQEESDLPLQFDLRFEVEGEEVYGSVYTPSPSFGGNRPLVLFFHGFTGYVRMDDVLMALLRAGCAVASIHHRGSWGSKGSYSFTNCIRDAEELTKWAQSEDFSRKYRTDPNAVFLMGHSLGGNTVLNALTRLTGVRGAILLTPCDISVLTLNLSEKERYHLYANNGVEVLTYDGVDALIQNVLDNAETMQFTNIASRINPCPLLIITAAKDPICPAETMVLPLLNSLNDVRYDRPIVCKEHFARHSLMGVRVKIAKDIAEFISEMLEG